MPAGTDILFTCHDPQCPGRPDDWTNCTFHQQVQLDERGRPSAPAEVIGPDCRLPLEERDIDDAIERWLVLNTPATHAPRDFGPLGETLWAQRGAFAQAAQQIYDKWDQQDGEPGGGICDEIAMAIANLIEADTMEGGHPGDDHAWVIATDWEREAYMVDIHHSHYERGGGYSWTKLPDVVFTADMVTVAAVDVGLIAEGRDEYF